MSRDKPSGDYTLSPTPFRGVMTLDSSETNDDTVSSQLLQVVDADDSHVLTPAHNKPQDALTRTSGAPAMPPSNRTPLETTTTTTAANPTSAPSPPHVRSRKPSTANNTNQPTAFKKRRKRRGRSYSKDSTADGHAARSNATSPSTRRLASACCCRDRTLVRSTWSMMNLLARILFWCSAIASTAAVIWYSHELLDKGTDKHLIAWFSAGAFVILGFPISMYGIVMHMANYNQPNVQMYVVRILWMVPIYSIESWLCLRYKDYAIYIETLRDFYESYVLYSFLQFLIQVLGGEEALILMLKDKSPTRGVHMWGLQWCVKPWLMGQPLRKTYESNHHLDAAGKTANTTAITSATTTAAATTTSTSPSSGDSQKLKRVHWTSPFFVKCKFGVLQYVLLKFVCAIVVMVLERYNIYKEGDFTPRGGYLYICILTNTSQCWALYCLIFFYYATKNELGPIRPVGKFLSVKALVFFTWWQSVMISFMYQMDLIPHYDPNGQGGNLSLHASDDDLGSINMVNTTQSMTSNLMMSMEEWSKEDVAKGIQDWLICIEMFIAALVHIFVFSHTEYDSQAVEARARALNQQPHKDWNKRLGRKWKEWDSKSGYSGTTNASSEVELGLYPGGGSNHSSHVYGEEEDDLRIHPFDKLKEHHEEDEEDFSDEEGRERRPLLAVDSGNDEDDAFSMESLESSELNDGVQSVGLSPASPIHENPPTASKPKRTKPGFVRALLDSAIPQDLRDNTVGIIKGDYVVEKKTLLHHAATSDSYELFSRVNNRHKPSHSSAASS